MKIKDPKRVIILILLVIIITLDVSAFAQVDLSCCIISAEILISSRFSPPRMFTTYPGSKTYFSHIDLSPRSPHLLSHGRKIVLAIAEGAQNISQLAVSLEPLQTLHAYQLRIDPSNFKVPVQHCCYTWITLSSDSDMYIHHIKCYFEAQCGPNLSDSYCLLHSARFLRVAICAPSFSAYLDTLLIKLRG